MKNPDEVARRLALLQGVEISPADLESIAKEIEDNLRIVAELEEFSQGIGWTALQVQPSTRKP
ncbi:MAG: hypothetical protein ACREQV_08825 [Candidatus Binatia bacterium]